MTMMRRYCCALAGLAVLALAGFACRSAYYAAWEAVGKEKRDLLRSDVGKVQDDQRAAVETFQSALDRLRALGAVNAPELESAYDKLNGDYQRAESRAEAVRARVASIESIAADLFAEWEREAASISSADLRAKSRHKLVATKQHYGELRAKLKTAEGRMDPVLTQLRDQVLYLKHNLNAAAIGGLRAEVTNIEGDIRQLVKDTQSSIAEANAFLDRFEK